MSAYRSYEVDIIRMVALIGICLVNVPFMAMPMEEIFSLPNNTPDRLATFLIEALFQLKFFLLFSFIFGWGMATQQNAAMHKGYSFNQRYLRRMIGLLLLGALHATLIFSGDILILYAVFGSLLWFLRDSDSKQLLKTALWMIPLSLICLSILVLILEEVMSGGMPEPLYSLGGNFIETVMVRINDWPETFGTLVLLQGPLVFAAFATGLAAGKSDFFRADHKAFGKLEQSIPWLLFLGLPLNILYALVMGDYIQQDWLKFLGFIGIVPGAPMLSAVYLYALVCFARNITLIPKVFILAGKNSLSSYVTQGVLAGLIFAHYGLGWFDQFGQFALLGIAFIIALAAMLLVGIYGQLFGRGPLETVLRKISGV